MSTSSRPGTPEESLAEISVEVGIKACRFGVMHQDYVPIPFPSPPEATPLLRNCKDAPDANGSRWAVWTLNAEKTV
jgi:hypothetical protein